MNSGGSFDMCAWIFDLVAKGKFPVDDALEDFPQCAPFVSSSGRWWWP